MNKDNAAQYLPYVQALMDGKTIQEVCIGGWFDLSDVLFIKPPEYYRVKPESVKRYIATWFNENRLQISDLLRDADFLTKSYAERPGYKLHELDCGEDDSSILTLNTTSSPLNRN